MASTIIYLYGRKVCPCLKTAIHTAEANLRAIGALPAGGTIRGLITQGSYNTSTAASAGTHAGGGALDVSVTLVNTDKKLIAWRKAGIAMWRRRRSEGPWNDHGHGIVIGCPHATAVAQRQVTSYRNGRNGLSGSGPDTGPRVPFISWQLAALNSKPAPLPTAPKPTTPTTPPKKETKMDTTELAAAILNFPVTANGKKQALVQHLADLFVATAAQSNAVQTELYRDKAQQAELLAVLNRIEARLK